MRKATNLYNRWTADEDSLLVELANKGKSTKQIARKLKRSIPSVWSRKYTLTQAGTASIERLASSRTKARKEKNTTAPVSTGIGSNPLMQEITRLAKNNGL